MSTASESAQRARGRKVGPMLTVGAAGHYREFVTPGRQWGLTSGMPEEQPELIEQIGTGPNGPIWKARHPDGREVLASQTTLTEESSRQAALDRLRRLAKIPSPQLAPVRGWWADAEGVWVVGDIEQGVGVPDLPGGGFLSPQQAAAISFGLLGGLETLYAEGLHHGALAAENVRVLPDGAVVLAGHQLSTLHFPSQDELAAELREAGRLVCQAFGVSPERDSRAAPRAIEHAAPALVVTARAIAAGAMGTDVRAAITALRETSGPLAGSERLSLGAGELASLVATRRSGSPAGEVRFRSLSSPIGSGGLAVPPGGGSTEPPPALSTPPRAQPAASPAGPAAAAAAVPAAVAPRRSWEERSIRPQPTELDDDRERGGPNWLLLGGIVAAVLLLGLVAWAGRGLLLGSGSSAGGGPATATPTPTATVSGTTVSPKTSPTAATSSSPGAVPTFAPAAAGAVRGVTLKADNAACAPGAPCTLNVVISFKPAGSPHDVTWAFKTFDPCTGTVTDFPGGTITAQGDWNTTDGNTTISLPTVKGQLAVVALSGPDVAASSPLLLGTAGC